MQSWVDLPVFLFPFTRPYPHHPAAVFTGSTGIIRPWQLNFSNASSTNKVEDEHDHGDHQQDVDEATGDVQGKSTTPDEQNDNGDNEKHVLDSWATNNLAAGTI